MAQQNYPTPPTHGPRKFDHLIGAIPGLSERQLRAHFGLYEGYVKKVGEIEEKLAIVNRSSPNYSYDEVSELLRRHAVPFNGAYLHELYFDNLSGAGASPAGELKAQLEREFGSIGNWWNDAKAGLISGYGWVLLTRSRFDGRLFNVMVEEHHRGLFCEQDILLALDGWEHAYMIDYGTAKKDYLSVLEKAIDWQVASRRLERALRSGRLGESQVA